MRAYDRPLARFLPIERRRFVGLHGPDADPLLLCDLFGQIVGLPIEALGMTPIGFGEALLDHRKIDVFASEVDFDHRAIVPV